MYLLSHVGDDADESFTVTLEDEEYKIRMRWNTYDEAWRISVGYSGQDASRTRKITVGLPAFIADHHIEGVPKGEIYLYDSLKQTGRAGRDDTGQDKRFQLIYVTSDEYDEYA